ncbi:MAG: ABC transporter ATP-binding protein [Chloroflexi bacterium]|nr:ABC transporter ATP-binding protein [Chloroflexota bacterium]
MATHSEYSSPQRGRPRPPHAVVGSQVERDEEMFGKAFNGHVMRRFGRYLRPYRLLLAAAIVAVLVFTSTQLAVPIAIRYAIDHGLKFNATDRSLLEAAVMVLAAVVVLNYLANFFQEIIVGRVAERVLFDLREAMYSHLQHVSLSFMDRTEVGRLMSRLQGDVAALQEFLETSVFAIGDFVLITGIAIVLIAVDWRLGLLTMSVVPVLLLIRIVWLPRARNAFMSARESSSRLNGALAEGINGVRTVQSMSREEVNATLFEEKVDANLKAQLKGTRYGQIMIPTVDTLTGVAMAIIIMVGGNFVLDQTLDVGVMVLFVLYVQRFFDPIRALTMQYSVMQRAMASGQRIFEVLDVRIDVEDKPDAIKLENIDGSVEFKNVTFGYNRNQPVLQDVSFRVNPGDTVPKENPTGSGKSTTMSLVHRFYDVWDGQVLIGGHDVRDVTQESLGHQIAMVLQEPYLFSGTILENIRYRKEEATREEVVEAARAVGAHEFIMRLPDGYETSLEQRGGNLSLGQRQLISFARAIVADAKILVLDEATANIDSYTEMLIQQALARLLQGRTGMVIAHRLATIRGADRIIVLQDGKIIEEGNHNQLMALGGLYARLYSMNYASFDDIPDELIQSAIRQGNEHST